MKVEFRRITRSSGGGYGGRSYGGGSVPSTPDLSNLQYVPKDP